MGTVRTLEVFIRLLTRKPRTRSANVPTQSRPTENTEDVFHHYSSLMHSSNSSSTPQLQRPRRKTENWPSKMDREKRESKLFCASKLLTKVILFSSPLYKYDSFKKNHFVTEPKTLCWLGLHSASILAQISPSLFHTGKQDCFYFTEMCNQIFIYALVIKV